MHWHAIFIEVRHIVRVEYPIYCVAYLVRRYYLFMMEHQAPTAGVTTIFSGRK